MTSIAFHGLLSSTYMASWLVTLRVHYQVGDPGTNEAENMGSTTLGIGFLYLISSWGLGSHCARVFMYSRYFSLWSSFHTNRYIMGPFSASLGTKPLEANSLHLGCFLFKGMRLLLESLMQLLIPASALFQGKWALS